MSRFKAGQSIVLDISEISDDGYYRAGNENQYWWFDPNDIDKVAEPLTDYTMPLINKIGRQRNGITSLLNQNADLKRENAELEAKYEALRKALNEFNKRVDDMCNTSRAEGQHEAWELARKCMLMTDREREAIFGSGHNALYGVLTYFDYKHAAAKVAEWERKKEEICVGDVVECEGSYGVVVGAGEVYVKGFTSDWTPFQWMKRSCTKTGRHIDVDAWLAQIGDER